MNEDYFDELLDDDDDDDEPAFTTDEGVACRTPIIVERVDGRQGAARGVFYWDADDPMVLALHFEIMVNSLCVDEKTFPIPAMHPETEPKVTCGNCGDNIGWGGMGAIIRQPQDPKVGILWCLMCAEEHPSTQHLEALWLLGKDALEGVLVGATPPEADVAVARAWRLDEDNFQVSLKTNTAAGLIFLTMPIERLTLILEAVRVFESERGDQAEDYLEKGLAELSKLANS